MFGPSPSSARICRRESSQETPIFWHWAMVSSRFSPKSILSCSSSRFLIPNFWFLIPIIQCELPALPIRQYVDACKIVKGLEPKFGYFVTKAAEAPKALETPTPEVEEVKPDKAKKARSAAGGAGSAAGSVWICVLVIWVYYLSLLWFVWQWSTVPLDPLLYHQVSH